MSVFFEYPTDVSAAGKGIITATGFSSNDHPILAVATSNGDLTLFHEEGETIAIELHTINGQDIDPNNPLPPSFSRPNYECYHLCWHPNPHPSQSILCCGWNDGTITIWSEKDRTLKEEQGQHTGSKISLLQWSNDGQRLLSADSNGRLCSWSIDNRHRLQLQSSYYQQQNNNNDAAVTHTAFKDNSNSFFYGTSGGNIYLIDNGHCIEIITGLAAPIKLLHYSNYHKELVIVTADVTLYKYKCNVNVNISNHVWDQIRRVKLSIKGDGSNLSLLLAGNGLLAASNNEALIRLWHLNTDDSYVLTFDGKHMATAKDIITSISFNPRKRVLAAGTIAGRIVFWRYIGQQSNNPSDVDWEALPAMESSAEIQHITWGPGEGLLELHNQHNVSIVLETVMQYKHVKQTAIIQLTADSLMLVQYEQNNNNNNEPIRNIKFNSNIRVKGLDLSDHHIMIWNGKRAEIREIRDDGSIILISSFSSKASMNALYGDQIYSLIGGRIEVSNLSGTVLQIITFAEHEGNPIAIHIQNQYMAVATHTACIKLWELTTNNSSNNTTNTNSTTSEMKKEPKLIVPHHQLLPSESSSMSSYGGLLVESIRVNCNGTRISLLCRRCDADGHQLQVHDTRIHVYDVEVDRVYSYEFGPNSYPVIHCWDQDDSRLLTVQSKLIEGKTNNYTSISGDEGNQRDEVVNHQTSDISTFFVTSDSGILLQDRFPVDPHNETLMSLCVPYFLFLTRPAIDDGNMNGEYQPKLQKKSMRDFIGLEHVSEDTKKDLLAFSYFLTIGNMDEAYRAVKKIDQEGIWNNMAALCVKTKRLDVAEVCLGNMNNARGVRAVRLAKQEPEIEVAIAEVAIQLHLLDDAERLYRECGRYDLLVKFYCACGRWKDAIQTATRSDRIHLKSTHYLYAKHLEQIGDYQTAIQHYELSNTATIEVPRLLFDQNMIKELELYVQQHPQAALLKWWAQYCESNGQYDSAIQYYHQAGEILALVRVYCYRGDERAAMDICSNNKDSAACYHLARTLEGNGQIENAIHYYCLAHRYNHAIRLGKEHTLDALLLNAALSATDVGCKLDAAQYFEQREYYEKAAMLYEKGGNLNKALDICFKGQLFDSLRQIAENLHGNTDPVLLTKCAQFFLQHQQYDKALTLYMNAKQYTAALLLAQQQQIRITDEMAEKMTPPKPQEQNNHNIDKEKKDRETFLLSLAALCRDQGSFHLACKKYTQAGDSISAIRCLIRSGDIEKIGYYASMTKKNEVFILAANYFQTLDWRNDPTLLQLIITFYQKAKANQPLAAFFDHCAMLEIDEYRDYEKALNALRESVKYLLKAKIGDKEKKVLELDQRIRCIEQFAEARTLSKSNPIEMIRICEELRSGPEIAGAVRIGDVYALLIEYYHQQKKYREAMTIIEQMKQRNIAIAPYVDTAMVKEIYSQNGITISDDDMEGTAQEEQVHEEVASF